MLFPATPARFAPRSAEATAAARRFAALRASITDLSAHVERLQKEQDVQFRRIAQLQQDIDEIKQLLKRRLERS